MFRDFISEIHLNHLLFIQGNVLKRTSVNIFKLNELIKKIQDSLEWIKFMAYALLNKSPGIR